MTPQQSVLYGCPACLIPPRHDDSQVQPIHQAQENRVPPDKPSFRPHRPALVEIEVRAHEHVPRIGNRLVDAVIDLEVAAISTEQPVDDLVDDAFLYRPEILVPLLVFNGLERVADPV